MIPRALPPALAGALACLAALHLLGWRPASDVPHYPRVQVDSAAVVQGEPSPEPGRLDRITRPVSRPEVVATAPGAAAGDVAGFCGAAGWSPPGATPPLPEIATKGTVPPTVSAPTAATQPRSGIPSALTVQPQSLLRSATIGRRTTDVWGVSSSGDLWRSTHRARPPVSIRVAGDSAVVQGYRGWWVRALAPVALCGAGGWLGVETGSRIPVVAGCGIGVYVAVR
jgi:hypothetical protein